MGAGDVISSWMASVILMATQASAPMVVMTPTPSFYTGDNLLEYHCSSPPQSPNGAVCRAYIIGVTDMYRASRTGRNRPVCVPMTVNQGEVQQVVVAWLQANPLMRKEPAAVAVRGALISKWPECATNR
jgi:hypothetical protein